MWGNVLRDKCVSNGSVRIALAGAGGYGEHYLQALLPRRDALGVQLVGVVDPDPQRCRALAALHEARIPIYADLQTLFANSAVDLMLIVTPIHLHADQTIFALEHGASVLCEKPVAATPQGGLRMLAAQRRAKGFVAIGYQWSFSEAVAALKLDIMQGVLGRPIRLKTLVLFPRSRGYFRRNDWAGRIRTDSGQDVFDSPANNAAAHYLHNMFYLLGPTRQSSAAPQFVQAELYRANEIENYDTIALRCRTHCGAEVFFYSTHAVTERRGPRSLWQFEHADVEFDALAGGELGGQFVARFRDGRVKTYGHPNADRHEKIWQSIDAVRGLHSAGNNGDGGHDGDGNGAAGAGAIACGIPAALPHALCVAAAQQSAGRITDFPAHLRRTIPFDDGTSDADSDTDSDTLICIDRLAEQFSDCYTRALLPAEQGQLDWSRPAATVALRRLPELASIEPDSLGARGAGSSVSVDLHPAAIASPRPSTMPG